MGYNAYITRAPEWSRNQGKTIGAEEWQRLATSAPELAVEDGAFCWRDSRFDWQDGNIVAKNPDQATLRKMAALAKMLAAAVQGDDGEVYDSSGAATAAPPPPSLLTASASRGRAGLESEGATAGEMPVSTRRRGPGDNRSSPTKNRGCTQSQGRAPRGPHHRAFRGWARADLPSLGAWPRDSLRWD